MEAKQKQSKSLEGGSVQPLAKRHPGGRPSKYDPKHCATVIEMMEQGCSMYEVAAKIGVARSTLYEWKEEHPEFSDTIKRGEELCRSWWEAQGRINLKEKEFNSTLWYMNMKNRHNWADRQEIKGEANHKHVFEVVLTNESASPRKADISYEE